MADADVSDRELEFCEEHTLPVYLAIQDIVFKKLSVDAHVSYRVTEEVMIHFWRDLERLYAIHHRLVHVTKSCSYLAFWVRKLKPISDAFPKAVNARLEDDGVPPPDAEIVDINEQVAIHLSIRLLRNCIRDGRILSLKGIDAAEVLGVFDAVVEDYLTSEIEEDMSMGLRFESMVYDMRFRTFGPHHLTQFLTHILREVSRACTEPQTS